MGERYEGYGQYSDDELIDRLRRGETPIMDYICDKYKNLVRSKAKSMFILGADSEDLIQEGMIGLFKAVRDYDMGRDASFATFAELCVNRQIYTAVQAAKRKKHFPLNTYVPLDGEAEGDDREGMRLAELLAERPDRNELQPDCQGAGQGREGHGQCAAAPESKDKEDAVKTRTAVHGKPCAAVFIFFLEKQ